MEVSSQKYFTLLGGSALSQWKQTNSKKNSAGYLFQNCRWKIAGSKLGVTTSIPSIQVTNIFFPKLGERSVDAKVGDHRPVLKVKLTKMGVKHATGCSNRMVPLSDYGDAGAIHRDNPKERM